MQLLRVGEWVVARFQFLTQQQCLYWVIPNKERKETVAAGNFKHQNVSMNCFLWSLPLNIFHYLCSCAIMFCFHLSFHTALLTVLTVCFFTNIFGASETSLPQYGTLHRLPNSVHSVLSLLHFLPPSPIHDWKLFSRILRYPEERKEEKDLVSFNDYFC